MSANGTILCEQALPGARFSSLPGTEILHGPAIEMVHGRRADVVALVATGGPVDRDLLDLLPRLRHVARFGVGYDEVDVDECTSRGIQVSITPGAVEVATAELTVALMLATRLRLHDYDALVREGGWGPAISQVPDRNGSAGATLGLVGFGRIGRRVAETARTLGMDIAYASRHRAPRYVERALEARRLPLDELMSSADVVSLHCPLNNATRALISRRMLSLMRNGSCLVNTARGPIVDQAALVDELVSGRLRAGLDVFDGEPDVPTALLSLPNVVLSPHVGSATRAAREHMTNSCIANIESVLVGESALHLVPEQQGARR